MPDFAQADPDFPLQGQACQNITVRADDGATRKYRFNILEKQVDDERKVKLVKNSGHMGLHHCPLEHITTNSGWDTLDDVLG